MADFHFHVERIKRSAGKSVVAAAAYRAGEKLNDDYYGLTHDYSKKAVVKSGIFLPIHAPPRLQDRETLWNEVEKVERHPSAQLAYSFDFSLQNEFSMEENIELAERFIKEQFVDRGMICDYAIHNPHRDDVPNPHVHVLCPIRPLTENGEWGNKRRREYELDENGKRVRDENGEYVFKSVYITDWDDPETLEKWRQAWAEYNNRLFEKKQLAARIDHRSYERQGVDKVPTIHEGPAVREMEKRGIRTRIGDFNRWVKRTRTRIKTLFEKLTAITDALAEIRREAQAQKEKEASEPLVIDLIGEYFQTRNLGAYSQKARNTNFENYQQAANYLVEHKVRTMDDLEMRRDELWRKTQDYKDATDARAKRRRELQDRINLANLRRANKAVYDKYAGIKFNRSREKYYQEHKHEIDTYRMTGRKLKPHLTADGKIPFKRWEQELEQLDAEIANDPGREEYKTLFAEMKLVTKIQNYAKAALKDRDLTPEQKMQKQLEIMKRRQEQSR